MIKNPRPVLGVLVAHLCPPVGLENKLEAREPVQARSGLVPERARLGLARPFHELAKEARLGSRAIF